MSREFITDNGEIFKRDIDGNYRRREGGRWSEESINPREFKEYLKESDCELHDIKNKYKETPHFTETMWDKSKYA